MKKKYIVTIIIIALVILDLILLYFNLQKKRENTSNIDVEVKPKDEVVEVNDMVFEYDSDIYIKDIVEIESDQKLDTLTLGEQTFSIKDNDKTYNLNYRVVDTTPPFLNGGSTITVQKGKSVNLVNKYLCGDNHDDKPNCYITGDYDLNKLGTYSLVYHAEDSSGNKVQKNFKLKVVSKVSSSTSSKPQIALSNYIKKYKTEDTMIGIDVSAWQGNIDYNKAKKDGVEFVIIRVGYGPSDGEYKLDKWFNENYKKAKAAKLDIGVYFYSYANSVEEAKKEVTWVMNKINHEPLQIGIAFDWENWSTFNKYNVSFKKLNDIASAFITEAENNGYNGYLYSSAFYLNRIWKRYDNTWLAYYTDNNDFSKPFSIWQATSRGKVKGISGNVDVDILYKKKSN